MELAAAESMIEKVHFRNFKALRDVHIQLERMTAFVGPNASGKTSVLEAVQGLCELFSKQPEHVFRGPQHPSLVSSRGAIDGCELEMEVTGRGMRWGCACAWKKRPRS